MLGMRQGPAHRAPCSRHAQDAQARGLRDGRKQLLQWRIGPLSCVEQGRHAEAVEVEDFEGPASHAHTSTWHVVTRTVRRHALPTC